MSPARLSPDSVIGRQCGLATRAQLRESGITKAQLQSNLAGRRWRDLNDAVMCTHNGPLSGEQARWAVVLGAPGLVALGGLTALEIWGVRGFASQTIHVLVPHGARVLPVPEIQVAVHQSRRFAPFDVLPRTPPVVSVERATIDAAVWSADVTTAIRVVTASIQQRLTTSVRLREELTAAGQVKFRRVLLLFLADLEGGAEALSEVAFLRWCRKHGFPKPTMQFRLDHQGHRRYLDAVFCTPEGRRVLVEIDGGIHLTLSARWKDTAKDNDAALAGETTLRFPSVAIYVDDPIAVRQLRRALEVGCSTGGYSVL